MATVCVIDDQEILRESLAETLTRDDHRVLVFDNAREALERIRRQPVDVVLTDLRMPQLDGMGLLRELRESGCEVPVIVMTAYGSVPSAVDAMKLGAFDYVQKPFDAEEICRLVERAVQQARLRRENEALRRSLEDWQRGRRLVGESRPMQALRAQIGQVAGSAATVLVQGESGTGKELVARAIHQASPRAGEPMLAINCAALSETLLESELFGHEKGAFTGADRTRKGRFELADGGTLLLDEISEVPLHLQAKLLRVLQEHQFERVGSSVTRTVDVRVIATTNRDLAEWVRQGRFREDLYYRLSVLPITVPPLRERLEDIPALVAYFLKRIAERDGRTPLSVTPEALEVLRAYTWPGNVRELENVCERASVLARGGVLDGATLRPWLTASAATNGRHRLRHGHMVEDMERQLIEQTLRQYNGHREKTAKALGIGVRTLGMKLKRYREEGWVIG